MIQEIYLQEEDLNDNTQLNDTWTLWESYAHDARKDNYADQTQIVYSFKTINEFVNAWSFLPLNHPSKLFLKQIMEDGQSKKISTMYQINGDKPDQEPQFKQIEGISLFRRDISPEWEHEENRNGCLYQFTFNITSQQIDFDLLWLLVGSALVGENITYSEQINGLRLVDKPTLRIVRLEIWLKNDKGTPEMDLIHRDLINDITQIFNVIEINPGKEPLYKSHKRSDQKQNAPKKH